MSGKKERVIFISSHSHFRPSLGVKPQADSIHNCIPITSTLKYALSAIAGKVRNIISKASTRLERRTGRNTSKRKDGKHKGEDTLGTRRQAGLFS